MTTPELTLNKVKNAAKVKNFRASDFLTDDEMEEVHKSNAQGKKNSSFDMVDAYIAEIIARFGYSVYLAWKNGEISEKHMAKYVLAERARDAQYRLKLENIIIACVSGANRPTKTGHAPKSLRAALKMLKREEKIAEGGK